ncbi:Atxe2 family lasso peptide isopeptidase [Sphingomonas sp. SUN019]|uniref:Atxe2 family lasso peptide isopeptidase n=1 Tax=Sphingomonas sp. SUN019 TaxID=2937788 RepID=UPI002164B8DB|nr:Atxe2 family lasso peptide isopeptidase [Sphingomonas sp. SUN019]UVO50149.1 Atxe2 family lasso peptide isopeptidase [Sphingomonas sp. SUN019]
MMRTLLGRFGARLAFALAAGAFASMAGTAHACSPFSPASRSAGGAAVTPGDLVALRDVGQSDASQTQGTAFGISPDGSRIALLVRRGDVASNTYCQALVVVTIGSAGGPKIIEVDAQPVGWAPNTRGWAIPNGAFRPNPPKWSPDGRLVAFLKPVAGKQQVLAIDLASRAAKLATAAAGGVDDFAWTPSGTAIVYATRPGLPAHEAAVKKEARTGFHYDDRISPMFALRPMIPSNLGIAYRVESVGQADERSATATERALVDPETVPGRPAGAFAFAADGSGRRAALMASDPERFWFSARILIRENNSIAEKCLHPTCRGLLFNVWLTDGAVIYLRREGWADSLTAIYRWQAGQVPRRLFATEDALTGCTMTESRLVCGREASRQPRRLWTLDTVTGAQDIIFDPNPGFTGHRLARVERLRWQSLGGAEGYGDLVVPGGPPPTQGFPMIVVQYRTRGFLRGGVGDEYPIFALAARGFAVLSLEEASFDRYVASDPATRVTAQSYRAAERDNGERRLQQANLEAGVAAARGRVRIDMARLGATGISDAASSAVYALATSNLFSVAALGTPVIDPTVLALGGHSLQRQFRELGYPPFAGDQGAFYRPIAMVPNAERFRVPMLFQWSATEYLGGMVSMAALEEARVPVDLYIYPGEYHVKSQPAHRLAVYERNLDWFDFWLNNRETADPEKREQYQRWRALRDQACAATPLARIALQLCNQASTSTSADSRG